MKWSGVTQPINEISNIHTNMIFLDASGCTLVRNSHETFFWPGFSDFDQLWKAQNWCVFTKLYAKSGLYGRNLDIN